MIMQTIKITQCSVVMVPLYTCWLVAGTCLWWCSLFSKWVWSTDDGVSGKSLFSTASCRPHFNQKQHNTAMAWMCCTLSSSLLRSVIPRFTVCQIPVLNWVWLKASSHTEPCPFLFWCTLPHLLSHFAHLFFVFGVFTLSKWVWGTDYHPASHSQNLRVLLSIWEQD